MAKNKWVVEFKEYRKNIRGPELFVGLYDTEAEAKKAFDKYNGDSGDKDGYLIALNYYEGPPTKKVKI